MTSVNRASREVGQPRGLAQAAEGCVWVGTHVGTVLIRVHGTGPLGQPGMLLYRSTLQQTAKSSNLTNHY